VSAGKTTSTGVTGYSGGIQPSAIHLTFNGFRKGFLWMRPGGRVLASVTDSFDDVGAA
jgi:basic membrane lipoprotein Med (substrate-binding protein (PBP1-ABC) superfamily)